MSASTTLMSWTLETGSRVEHSIFIVGCSFYCYHLRVSTYALCFVSYHYMLLTGVTFIPKDLAASPIIQCSLAEIRSDPGPRILGPQRSQRA